MALGDELGGGVRPHGYGLASLVQGHGRLFHEVGRALGHLGLDQAGRVVKVIVDSHVHHPHLGPGVARQHIDARASGQEVEHHLWSHLGGIRAHPGLGHSVVGGKHGHRRQRLGPVGRCRESRPSTGPILPGAPGSQGVWSGRPGGPGPPRPRWGSRGLMRRMISSKVLIASPKSIKGQRTALEGQGQAGG